MGGPNHFFKTTINLKTNCKFVNTYCSVEDNYTAFPTNNVCLLVIFNSKTRYPKGAVQQMEVEIAALYNTMHINLQCTDWSGVGAEAMDLNMATDSYVQLSVTAFNFKIYICYDSSCPRFFHFSSRSLTVFYSKSGIFSSSLSADADSSSSAPSRSGRSSSPPMLFIISEN